VTRSTNWRVKIVNSDRETNSEASNNPPSDCTVSILRFSVYSIANTCRSAIDLKLARSSYRTRFSMNRNPPPAKQTPSRSTIKADLLSAALRLTFFEYWTGGLMPGARSIPLPSTQIQGTKCDNLGSIITERMNTNRYYAAGLSHATGTAPPSMPRPT
jgi:hypothetical protein